MPVFYFNLVGDDVSCTDIAGRYCPGLAAARSEAHRLASEIITNGLIAGDPPLDATIEVEDEDLRPVLALPLREAAC